MRTFVLLIFVLLVGVACGGCGSWFGEDPSAYAKPTIAVLPFENRAPFPLQWNLGTGVQQVLVDRLVAAKRYQVIERPELDSILQELQLQHSGVTRPQQRAELGRLKNVQYLVKGVITDFGHVSTSRGFLGGGGWGLFGGRTKAVMGMTMYVIDVASGEIIASESLNESVSAKDVAVEGTYRGVAFGGSTFYQTPLGQATRSVIAKAVKRITTTIASRPWVPKIAAVHSGGTVIINGGADRKLKQGTEYNITEQGEGIINPDSGDIIGHNPGRAVARIRITQVCAQYSVATVTAGDQAAIQVGQRCGD